MGFPTPSNRSAPSSLHPLSQSVTQQIPPHPLSPSMATKTRRPPRALRSRIADHFPASRVSVFSDRSKQQSRPYKKRESGRVRWARCPTLLRSWARFRRLSSCLGHPSAHSDLRYLFCLLWKDQLFNSAVQLVLNEGDKSRQGV